MEVFEADVRDFQPGAQGVDANLAVRFFTHPIMNEDKSTQEGRPIFDDTEMIEIRVRGDRNNIIQRPVRPEDKRRFREAYKAYTEEAKELEDGTPLNEWPLVTKSMVEELKYLGFRTVEHVAVANDGVCARVPGLTQLKQRAQAFLDIAKGTAPLEKLQSELEAERMRNAALQAQMADLAQRVEQLMQKGVRPEGEDVSAAVADSTAGLGQPAPAPVRPRVR